MALLRQANRIVYKFIAKPLFFSIDPEWVHDQITKLGQFWGKSSAVRFLLRKQYVFDHPMLGQEIWGINFKNPVGLAAGFDKDGKIYPLMESVGFGFAEVGTVTYRPYQGNPKPRLHRLPNSKALVVNYGLKNSGALTVARLLKNQQKNIPQVISIGRTNSPDVIKCEDGITDYLNCFKEFVLADVGDIYEINISCPNTFGGEPFTGADELQLLLKAISSFGVKRPIFIKMPINLPWPQFRQLIDVALEFGVEALVIGNLNKNKRDPAIQDKIPEHINGNISGQPTKLLSNHLISATYQYCGDKIKIIGVGGIFSAEDAYEKICRGASLVELITGMIYEGPQLMAEINEGLVILLKKDGFKNISEAVGTFRK